jgi:hypothetical protein
MSKPEKQPALQQDQPSIEEQPLHPIVAKVLEYEPYILALQMERDQDYTYLLGEMLRGNTSVEPRILELVESVKEEGIDLKIGQLEASRRLRGVMEADKTLSKIDAIRLLYDDHFMPGQSEEISQPKTTRPSPRRLILQPETGATAPEFTDSLKQILRERAIASVERGIEGYLKGVAEEIDRKVEETMALYPKSQPAPQAISFDRFNLEDWDPETDGNVVVVREKPQPRIKLATDTDDDKPTFRLQ